MPVVLLYITDPAAHVRKTFWEILMSDVRKLNVLQVWIVSKKVMFALKINALMYARHRLLVAIMLFVYHKYIAIPVSVEKDILETRSLDAENDYHVIPMTIVQTLNSVISTTSVAVPAVLIVIVIKTRDANMESVFKFVRPTLIALMITTALIGSASQESKANVNQIMNVKIIWDVVRMKEDIAIVKTYVRISYVVVTQFAKYAITYLFANVIQDLLVIQLMRNTAVKQSNVLIIKTVNQTKFALTITVSIRVVNEEFVAITLFAVQNNIQQSVDVSKVSKEIQWPVVYLLIIALNKSVIDQRFAEIRSADMNAFAHQKRISVLLMLSPDVEVLTNVLMATLIVLRLQFANQTLPEI